MKRLLVILLTVVTIGLGGAKFYLWYQTRQVAHELIRTVSPFATVTYGGITTSLTGRAGLEDLIISPRGVRDDIRVAALELQAADLGALLAATRELGAQRWPTALSLHIRGLELTRDGPIVAAMTQPQMGGLAPHPFAAIGCADIAHIGANELEILGYDRLRSDLELKYTLQDDGRVLRVQLRSLAQDMASVTATMEMETPDFGRGFQGAFPPEAAFSRGEIRYVDQGFNRRLARFCSARMGSDDSNTFLDRHLTEIEKRLQRLGLAPDAALLDAYRGFAQGSGELTLRLEPEAPVKTAQLALYEPSDALRLLGLRLSINGADVALTSGSAAGKRALQALLSEPVPRSVSDQPTLLPPPGPRFHRIETTELPLYIGRPIRLSLLNGKRYEGVLEGLRTDNVLVKRDVMGGSMTIPVAMDEVRDMEVSY